ncbi:MAG: molecular chaperone [Kluyvera sp.]|uniref:fimbrial biogenesis chaperone n=1 Tax=Kluyvera sp. TaxID=1538228 RepID=UPI003A868310
MRMNMLAKGICCLLWASTTLNAAVTPDRTRIIFNQSDKNVSLRLTNKSEKLPFLAQSWIEDNHGKKSRNYFTALPPMIRLEAGEQVQVRLVGQTTLSQLPADRETLFYYNVREIPPRSQEKNVMQIAMQSRLKLFWRPKAIEITDNQFNPEGKVDISRTANGMALKNNSPYYLTIGYIGTNGKTLLADTQSIMIEPFGQSSAQIKNLPTNFQIGFIGDYGGVNMFKVSCNSVQAICQMKTIKKG